MRKTLVLIVCLLCVISFGLVGCGSEKASSPKAAIEHAKTLQTTVEQVNYLISQAQAYYNSKEFQGTVDLAQYVLSYLDSDSQAAKDLVTKAKEAITAAASAAAEAAKSKLGSFGQ